MTRHHSVDEIKTNSMPVTCTEICFVISEKVQLVKKFHKINRINKINKILKIWSLKMIVKFRKLLNFAS